ncbi:MAG: GNAT family N-acetyltransferase [Clostridiales bacterium]|nr:GNAT family N-acetyltransferase [Clostridiales bacterium]
MRIEKALTLPEGCEDIFLGCDIYEVYFRFADLRTILEKVAEAGELYICFDDEGEPVGAMWIMLRGFCGLYPYLKLIGVRRDRRGEGIGREMLAFFHRLAAGSGAKKVTLMVSDFNISARRLYDSLGYSVLGEIPGAARKGITEILMIKDI